MRIKSYSKINLYLKILSRVDDGYHHLETVFQEIDLYDLLTFDIKRDHTNKICIEMSNYQCPIDSKNIIWKAIELFRRKTALNFDVTVKVEKNIPLSAGLAGGSSNATATLKFLNDYFHQPLDSNQMNYLCAALGSDTSFFLLGGTAFGEKRGEKLSQLPFIGEIPLVLINPGFPVPTRYIYENFVLTRKGEASNIPSAFLRGHLEAHGLKSLIHNDLERTVFRLYPKIKALKRFLLNHNADGAMVSGSGGTVFGVFENAQLAQQVAYEANRKFSWSIMTKMIDSRLIK